jgi:hypothetical protein
MLKIQMRAVQMDMAARPPHRRSAAATLAVGLTLALVTLPALTDPITDQIDAAKRAYEAGDPRVAIQALEFAATQIQKQIETEQLGLLPQPLPGWSADEPTSATGGIAAVFAGTNLTRTYREDAGSGTLTVTITADSPVLSMLTTLMQANPTSTPYTRGGYRGMLEVHEGGSTKILLMIGTRIQIQIDGTGTDQRTLEAYIDAMDLKRLEKALLG